MFRYTAGKADWFASGLPREGKEAAAPRAIDAARRDVPTCGLQDRIAAVGERVRAAGWDYCVVVNDNGIVLGRLRRKAFAADAEATAETVMEPGPPTFRPDARLDGLVKHLRERGATTALITTSDGELMGLLFREEAERHLTGARAAAAGRA